MQFLIVVVLILLLIGALPAWPYSRQWGYFPSGVLAVVAMLVLILLLVGYL